MKCRYRKVNIIVLGVQGTGKTSLLNFILKDKASPLPTRGFSFKKCYWKNKLFIKFYDVGGSVEIRNIWKNYFNEVHGIIYMIDSTSPGNFQEDKNIISELCSNVMLKGKPFLILANKKDLPNSVSGLTLCQILSLPTFVLKSSDFIYFETSSCLFKANKAPSVFKKIQKLYNKNVKIYPEMNSAFNDNVGTSIKYSYPNELNPFDTDNYENPPSCSYSINRDDTHETNSPIKNRTEEQNEQMLDLYHKKMFMALNWLCWFIYIQFNYIEEIIAKDKNFT